jgi:hypothetical protein
MDLQLKALFLSKWNQYFKGADLPFVFFYSDTPGDAQEVERSKRHSCMICDLAKVRNGESLAFDEQAIGCAGGRRYLGFSDNIRVNFEYFLSCGIPGELEGERYIRTPEQVLELMKDMKLIPAGKKYIIFRRWDKIGAEDDPLAVIFFATPDVLSGLYTLAGFDREQGEGVAAPFGSGCSSIVYHPLREAEQQTPKAVLGMFDVSARPCVPDNTLSFSVPMNKFVRMVSFMDESFLITDSWKKVMKRIS